MKVIWVISLLPELQVICKQAHSYNANHYCKHWNYYLYLIFTLQGHWNLWKLNSSKVHKTWDKLAPYWGSVKDVKQGSTIRKAKIFVSTLFCRFTFLLQLYRLSLTEQELHWLLNVQVGSLCQLFCVFIFSEVFSYFLCYLVHLLLPILTQNSDEPNNINTSKLVSIVRGCMHAGIIWLKAVDFDHRDGNIYVVNKTQRKKKTG